MLPSELKDLPEETTVFIANGLTLGQWVHRYLESGMAEHDWHKQAAERQQAFQEWIDLYG